MQDLSESSDPPPGRPPMPAADLPCAAVTPPSPPCAIATDGIVFDRIDRPQARTAPQPDSAATRPWSPALRPANPEGVVGPNAVRHIAAALDDMAGGAITRDVFDAAGLGAFLRMPPREMVDQRLVAQVHLALDDVLTRDEADAISIEAGRRTARYILDEKIPKPVQAALRALPARIASRMLMRSLRANAWTFAGTGRVRVSTGYPATLTIVDNPVARPGCPWHRSALTTLFRALVDPDAQLGHTTCCAHGDSACRFEVHAPAARPRHRGRGR